MANTITTISPSEGEIWAPGSTRTIKWTYTGNPGSAVAIHLYRGTSHPRAFVQTIIASTPIGIGGTGSYSWAIPSVLESTTKYSLTVRSTQGIQYGFDWSDIFSISRGVTPPPSNYQLVWNDEFDGASLNLSKWNIAYGSASVSNSILKLGPNAGEIVARTVPGYTKPKYLFRYGYIEVKMRFAFDPNNPTVHRRTHRTGPWLAGGWNTSNISNPTKGIYGGELDITETASGPIQSNFTRCGGNKINTSIHKFLNSSPYSGSSYTYGSRIYAANFNFSDTYHILGFEWTPNYIRTILDGYEILKVTKEQKPIPESYMYPIIGLCPRCWPLYGPNNPYSSPCPSDVPTGREIALVDYIRIYQFI